MDRKLGGILICVDLYWINKYCGLALLAFFYNCAFYFLAQTAEDNEEVSVNFGPGGFGKHCN